MPDDSDSVWRMLRATGAVLFRNAAPSTEAFCELTDRYTADYVTYPSPRRSAVTEDDSVQTVVDGTHAIALHAELSYAPWRPLVLWFRCADPGRAGGESLLCDGVAVARALSPRLRERFRARRLRYTDTYSAETWKRLFHCDDRDEAIQRARRQYEGAFTPAGDDALRVEVETPILAPTMFGQEAFARNLLLSHGTPDELPFDDGTLIADDDFQELRAVAESLTWSVPWQAGDVIMIDNTRMMHGRTALLDPRREVHTRFARGVRFTTRADTAARSANKSA